MPRHMIKKAFAVFLICFIATFCADSTRTKGSVIVPFSMNELKQRTFHYFWDLADPEFGQVPDRYPSLTFSSIAATGFGLSTYITGIENGYITREEGARRTLMTLQALWNMPQGPEESGVSGYKGFFYHFLTLDKAVRFKQVELSSIDTGLLMAGILSAMTYYDGPEGDETSIRNLADSLYRRVEWDWMLNDSMRLSMGWHPEKGFIASDWRGYNEAMVLLIMAIGSPTHPVPTELWDTWCSTYRWMDFQGYEHVNFAPLFGHQYSQMFIDFRGIQDEYMRSKGIDYFENARRATLANRAYCIQNPGGFKGYDANQWGLTACDGPASKTIIQNGKSIRFRDYWARGACAWEMNDDGTIAPTAAGGSIPFAPEACIPAVEHLWNTYYNELVDTFGFKDAFNLTYQEDHPEGWFDVDYLGIDQGPIAIQIQNYETGLIWNVMKRNPYIREGLRKAGFSGGWLDQPSKL